MSLNHSRLAQGYRRFRGGWWFLAVLSALIGAAMGAHAWLGYDPDFTITNLCLSIEASVSVALLLASQESTDRANRILAEFTAELVKDVHRRVVKE